MEDLNNFEKEILTRFSNKYDFLKSHLPYLAIKNREYTGVGLYINFFYTKNVESLPLTEASISTDEIINIRGLKYGLFFEMVISDGKIDFIEFVTVDEMWDGNFLDYSFEPI
jgi:hypothetical protein